MKLPHFAPAYVLVFQSRPPQQPQENPGRCIGVHKNISWCFFVCLSHLITNRQEGIISEGFIILHGPKAWCMVSCTTPVSQSECRKSGSTSTKGNKHECKIYETKNQTKKFQPWSADRVFSSLKNWSSMNPSWMGRENISSWCCIIKCFWNIVWLMGGLSWTFSWTPCILLDILVPHSEKFKMDQNGISILSKNKSNLLFQMKYPYWECTPSRV